MKKESKTPSDRRINIIIAVCVFIILVSLVIDVYISENSTGSTDSISSISKCTICGKAATHTFQGSGYCTKHYKDAIVWAMDNVNSK